MDEFFVYPEKKLSTNFYKLNRKTGSWNNPRFVAEICTTKMVKYII